jgi:hypothetical protein
MKISLLKSNSPLLATLATLLFIPALTRAATVIDHVPYTITESGNYELHSSLIANGTDGIIVQAVEVVINLNGFTLTGSGGGNTTGVKVDAYNVTVLNGRVANFSTEVALDGNFNKAQDLIILCDHVGVLSSGDENAVVNCFIGGTGKRGTAVGISVDAGSGTLVQNNQVSKCKTGVLSGKGNANAFNHNYVSNSDTGLDLSDADCYQGNVVTSCNTAFKGGRAIGGENGSD